MINDENYINIQGWMITKMGLKNNELLVYAIIYGFSQDGKNGYEGTLQYLADWCSSTKQGVSINLKSLVDKGYLIKEEEYRNNVKFCKYKAVLPCQINYRSKFNGIKESLIPSKFNGIKESLMDNIYNKELSNNKLLSNSKLLDKNKNIFTNNIKVLDETKTSNNSSNNLFSSKKPKKKDLLKFDLLELIKKYFLDEEILEKLKIWILGQYELNKLPTKNGLELSLQELSKFRKEEIINAINNSIKSGYNTFYPKEIKNITRDGINENSYTDLEAEERTKKMLAQLVS